MKQVRDAIPETGTSLTRVALGDGDKHPVEGMPVGCRVGFPLE